MLVGAARLDVGDEIAHRCADAGQSADRRADRKPTQNDERIPQRLEHAANDLADAHVTMLGGIDQEFGAG